MKKLTAHNKILKTVPIKLWLVFAFVLLVSIVFSIYMRGKYFANKYRYDIYQTLSGMGCETAQNFEDFNIIIENNKEARILYFDYLIENGNLQTLDYNHFCKKLGIKQHKDICLLDCQNLANYNIIDRIWLYKRLKSSGVNVEKNFYEFNSALSSNAEISIHYYNQAKRIGLDVGEDYNEFTELFGDCKKTLLPHELTAQSNLYIRINLITAEYIPIGLFDNKLKNEYYRKEIYDIYKKTILLPDYDDYIEQLNIKDDSPYPFYIIIPLVGVVAGLIIILLILFLNKKTVDLSSHKRKKQNYPLNGQWTASSMTRRQAQPGEYQKHEIITFPSLKEIAKLSQQKHKERSLSPYIRITISCAFAILVLVVCSFVWVYLDYNDRSHHYLSFILSIALGKAMNSYLKRKYPPHKNQ